MGHAGRPSSRAAVPSAWMDRRLVASVWERASGDLRATAGRTAARAAPPPAFAPRAALADELAHARIRAAVRGHSFARIRAAGAPRLRRCSPRLARLPRSKHRTARSVDSRGRGAWVQSAHADAGSLGMGRDRNRLGRLRAWPRAQLPKQPEEMPSPPAGGGTGLVRAPGRTGRA